MSCDVKLILVRDWTKEMIQSIQGILSHEEVRRYLPFTEPLTFNETENFLKRLSEEKFQVWVVKEGDHIVGLIDLINREGRGSLAYFLIPTCWGRGIATHIISQVTNYGFNVLDLKEIQAPVLSRNTGSQRVLIKNGFIHNKNREEKVCFDGEEDLVMLFVKKS